MKITTLCALIYFVKSASMYASQYGFVSGTVKDFSSNLILKDVEVFTSNEKVAITNNKGFFIVMSIPLSSYALKTYRYTFKKSGYYTKSALCFLSFNNSDCIVDVKLVPIPVVNCSPLSYDNDHGIGDFKISSGELSNATAAYYAGTLSMSKLLQYMQFFNNPKGYKCQIGAENGYSLVL